MRKMKNVAALVPRPSLCEDPAFIQLTEQERQAKPELRDVEALRLFTTKTGVTLVCLITDRKTYLKNRIETSSVEEWGM